VEKKFIDEAERSIHDAIMIVRRTHKTNSVVAGAGATEMEISKFLRTQARNVSGKQQLMIMAFAKALEVIPRTVCDNSGFDSTNILTNLRKKHSSEDGKWFGVDIENENIFDAFENFIWEPTLVKTNIFTAATEACCLILSIDETIKNESSQGKQ